MNNPEPLKDIAYRATVKKFGLKPKELVIGKKYSLINYDGSATPLGKLKYNPKIEPLSGFAIFNFETPTTSSYFGVNRIMTANGDTRFSDDKQINVMEDADDDIEGGKYRRTRKMRKSRKIRTKVRRNRRHKSRRH